MGKCMGMGVPRFFLSPWKFQLLLQFEKFLCWHGSCGTIFFWNCFFYDITNPNFMHYPIGCRYGIFTCIWLIFKVNVGKYTIHGSYFFCGKLIKIALATFASRTWSPDGSNLTTPCWRQVDGKDFGITSSFRYHPPFPWYFKVSYITCLKQEKFETNIK